MKTFHEPTVDLKSGWTGCQRLCLEHCLEHRLGDRYITLMDKGPSPEDL